MAIDRFFQLGNMRAQFIARVQIFRMEHLVDLSTFLFCRIFQTNGFLQQCLLKTLIPLRAKNALHDGTAILDLSKQKPLKLSLRQQDDLTKLICIKADELTDALRHLGHI